MVGLTRHPTGGDPRLMIGRCVVMPSRSTSSPEKRPDVDGPPRARQLAATPVARYAALVFLLAAALVVAVAVTLDRNAHRSSWQEHTTALAGGARSAPPLRVAPRQPARRGDAARHLAPAAARRRDRERRRAAQDRRQPPRPDRRQRPLDRRPRRIAADLLDRHDHRRPACARDRDDRAAARGRGPDASSPGDACCPRTGRCCSCGTAA